MTPRIACLLAAAGCTLAGSAAAADFSVGSLSQDDLRGLSRDLGAAMSYKGVTPGTALGASGFDIGIEATDTRLENSTAFARAGVGSRSNLVVPKLHVNKGLVGGLDIGAFVGGSTEINATVIGADLRYAVIDDTLTSPALAVRISGTRLNGTGDLRLATAAADLMVSKAFTLLTPYIGAGAVRVEAQAHNTSLAQQNFSRGRVFGGVNLNLVGANLAIEAEKMGDNTSLSAKVGIRF
jgi:hypothetical protein